jgi:hypothetical protein
MRAPYKMKLTPKQPLRIKLDKQVLELMQGYVDIVIIENQHIILESELRIRLGLSIDSKQKKADNQDLSH